MNPNVQLVFEYWPVTLFALLLAGMTIVGTVRSIGYYLCVARLGWPDEAYVKAMKKNDDL